MTEVDLAAARELLRGWGAEDIGHPGGTLLEPFGRVTALLAGWRAAGEAQLAALCHAAYGTDGFDIALLRLDERSVLADAIGAR